MSQPDVPQRKQTAIRTDDPYFTDTVSRKKKEEKTKNENSFFYFLLLPLLLKYK